VFNDDTPQGAMQEDRYQTYNAKQKYRASRKITANLQCKCYAGEQEKGHCPYYKNVADLRLPITQGSWAIKDYDCARLEQISRRQ
jgi:hypothetical protein